MAAVTVQSDFGAQEEKVCTVSTFSPSICHAMMGPDAMILVFASFFTLLFHLHQDVL